MTADIKAVPLAVWDANDSSGLFRKHLADAAAWAIAHLGQEVAARTYRMDFYLIDVPFAVLYQIVTDPDGRKLAADPSVGGPRYADPVVQLLDELPPPRLLGEMSAQ